MAASNSGVEVRTLPPFPPSDLQTMPTVKNFYVPRNPTPLPSKPIFIPPREPLTTPMPRTIEPNGSNINNATVLDVSERKSDSDSDVKDSMLNSEGVKSHKLPITVTLVPQDLGLEQGKFFNLK